MMERMLQPLILEAKLLLCYGGTGIGKTPESNLQEFLELEPGRWMEEAKFFHLIATVVIFFRLINIKVPQKSSHGNVYCVPMCSQLLSVRNPVERLQG
ncbi:uncharacterized protein AAG666_023481 isoform 2-T3 [Megaptera novaeangliae]